MNVPVGRDRVVRAAGVPSGPSIIGGIAILAAGAILGAFVQIPAGYVGVVRQFGAVTGMTLDPGLHFVTPFVNSVDQIDTRVRPSASRATPLRARSSRTCSSTRRSNYHVDPRSAPRIVQELGLNFEDTIIRPRFLDIPKSITDDYPTDDRARTAVTRSGPKADRTSWRAQLEPRGIIVDGISFENFSYSDAYNQAIEEKQAAQQQVETERQRLAQQEIIAQQRVATARGEAEAADRACPR